jgi:nucleotide-binding universal stress UspA family protein
LIDATAISLAANVAKHREDEDMLRQIIAALDGSALAESSLPLAENLARVSGAHLTLVRAVASGETLEVFDETNPNVLRYVPPASTSSADPLVAREVMRDAKEYLLALANDISSRGVTVETSVLPGEPADILTDEARLRHADLIVMSTHGRSGLGRWLYGSVAEAIIARTAVPVLLVRSAFPSVAVGTKGNATRLLVPLDGSVTAEKALEPAADLAQGLGAELFLVRVIPSSPASMTHETIDFEAKKRNHPPDSYEREAETYLDEVATRLRSEGLRVFTAVANDYPPAGIVAAAQASNATMIVMGTHGRTGLGRAILGSVALDVLRRGTRPVLLVRPCPAPT